MNNSRKYENADIRMRSVTPMRIAKIGYIALSIVFCIVGVLLVAWSDIGTQVLSLALGIAMIVFGGIKIVGYFSKDLFRLAFQFDLELGIISAVLGIIVLLNPFGTITFIFIAMGIAILADALFKSLGKCKHSDRPSRHLAARRRRLEPLRGGQHGKDRKASVP